MVNWINAWRENIESWESLIHSVVQYTRIKCLAMGSCAFLWSSMRICLCHDDDSLTRLPCPAPLEERHNPPSPEEGQLTGPAQKFSDCYSIEGIGRKCRFAFNKWFGYAQSIACWSRVTFCKYNTICRNSNRLSSNIIAYFAFLILDLPLLKCVRMWSFSKTNRTA